MNTDTFKKILTVLLAASVIPLMYYLTRGKKEYAGYSVLNDTSLVSRYEREIKRDTVYRFIDRIVYRNAKPDVVYVQKTDTIFNEKISGYDLPLKLEKSGSELILKAVNFKDSVLKEYVYRNVGKDFSVSSARNGFNIRSKNFSLDEPEISFKAAYLPGEKTTCYELSGEAGFSFRDKVSLHAGCGYETRNGDFRLFLTVKLKGL